MNKMFNMAAAALMLLALGAGADTARAQGYEMPIKGATTQPVGHYDFCKRFASMCEANRNVGMVKLSHDMWAELIEVNNAVNTAIFPRTDQEMHGVPEYWSYPTTEGDCEDFALLKQYMLMQRGVPASALLITVVRQTNGEGHAVLTVRSDKGDYVLDNLEERVLAWQDTDYLYLKRQSERDPGKWVAIADDRNVLVGSVR